MRTMRSKIIITVLFICYVITAAKSTSYAKPSKITIDLTGCTSFYKRPSILKKADKVKVINDNKDVVKVKYIRKKNDRKLLFSGKKIGKATVKIKCYLNNGKIKTRKYVVKVKRSKEKTDLDYAKEAFKIQNKYRSEKNVTPLEWSDELYEFALYRLRTSGFDRHENLVKDTKEYFGGFAEYHDILFGENMYSASSLPKNAMSSWKNSVLHYSNLMDGDHRCGAIARYGIMWCAIFYDGDKSDFINWDLVDYKKVNIKRFDTASGEYISSCRFSYYESGNKDSIITKRIKDESGREIYLETGRTYVIYEQTAPPGYIRAKKIIVTTDDKMPDELILK